MQKDKLNNWSEKSKSYKINYFGALGELFKRIENDTTESMETLSRAYGGKAEAEHKKAKLPGEGFGTLTIDEVG
jgi:hypothetical protein